jgi:hypothetical protein
VVEELLRDAGHREHGEQRHHHRVLDRWIGSNRTTVSVGFIGSP